MLTAGDLLRDPPDGDDAPAPRHRFVATGDPEPFHRLARRFLGPDVGRGGRRPTGARVKLTIVGCSGSVPGPDSAASSYLVEHEGYRLLLDLGSGAFGALQRHLDPAEVDAVVLSHLHPDHCFDVGPDGRVPPARAAPAGRRGSRCSGRPARTTGWRWRTTRHARGGLHDLFDVAAVTPGERELGPFRLRFERVNHPVPTHAVRVGGRRPRRWRTPGTPRPSDALVVRWPRAPTCCSARRPSTRTPANPPDLHLTGREAGEHADRGRRRPAAGHPRAAVDRRRPRPRRRDRRVRRPHHPGRRRPDVRPVRPCLAA